MVVRIATPGVFANATAQLDDLLVRPASRHDMTTHHLPRSAPEFVGRKENKVAHINRQWLIDPCGENLRTRYAAARH
jgi:hypothetical protein